MIKEEYKKIIKEGFWRVPKDVIESELYVALSKLHDINSSLATGHDFHPDDIDEIIDLLHIVKTSAKKFNKKEDVPTNF